jgi:hypothetical protein
MELQENAFPVENTFLHKLFKDDKKDDERFKLMTYKVTKQRGFSKFRTKHCGLDMYRVKRYRSDDCPLPSHFVELWDMMVCSCPECEHFWEDSHYYYD